MRLSLAAILLVSAARSAAGEPVTATPVTLSAADGTKLAATYFAGEKPGPGILLLHQCNRDRSTWSGVAGNLAKEGFHVLTLDFRGFGESGGKPFADLTPEERDKTLDELFPADVDVAYGWLRAQPAVQGVVGAGGASCGVNQSIQLSRRHPGVKSLVLLSGGTNRSSRQYLRSRSSPPLMIAAADDDGNVVQYMEWIEASSGNPTNRFVEYKAGGHGTNMFQAHPELPGEIVAWYDATLAGKGKPASTNNLERRKAGTTRLLMMTDEPDAGRKVIEKLTAERRTNPRSRILEEAFVNRLGYMMVGEGDAKGGIAVFRFNVDAHPQSANAWDSLGDGYLADGQRDKAREASEKTLQLVDSDTSVADEVRKAIRESAEGKLNQLKAAPTAK
jgi:dienelactone hydrolase